MKRHLFILLFFIMGVAFANSYADEVTLTIEAPATAVEGAQIQLRYALRGGSSSDIRLDEGALSVGFDKLYGPSIATHQSYSNINGKVTQDGYIMFTYILLAKKAGTYTLPAATVNVDGKSHTSKTAQIKVLPPDKNAQPQQAGRQPQATTSTSTGEVSKDDAFVRAIFSKTKVYEQEAVMVTFRLYSVLNIRDVGKIQFPEFEGFMAEEVELSANRQMTMEHYRGRNYYVIDVKKTLLFPQRSGKLTIPAGMMDLVFEVKSGHQRRIFGQSMDVMTEARKTLRTSPETVNVSTLPTEGKPLPFSGAVGTFTFDSSISSQEVKANDAVTLKLEIKGTGNMKLIKNPEVKLPEEFEKYDPKIDNSNLHITENGLSGTKVIEYMFIPRAEGSYTIPPVEFTYFDSKTGTYKVLKSAGYTMKVDRDPNAGRNTATSYMNQIGEDVMKDIRYLKTGDFRFASPDRFLFGSLANILWYVVPLLLFVILSVVYRNQIKANANVALMRTKKANKVAIRRLKLANKYLQANNKDSFYEEMLRATWGYLSDKLTIPVAELNRENIEYELKKYGVDDSLVKRFIDILDTCEFARYAPAESDKAMDKLYKETVNTIGEMENVIKR